MAQVKLYGVWGSPYSRRVEIALKIKGIEYEYVEVDIDNKSDELLKYNPIYKKIPVLVHDGKPIVESLLILEYIDDVWKENPILPMNSYDRAQVRFWAKFIDDKITSSVGAGLLSQGEDSQKTREELQDLLKTLEKEIATKTYFGGNKIGYLDIVGLFVAYWVPIVQEILGKRILTRDNFPGIYEWADEVMDKDFVKENLPDKSILLPILQSRFAPK